MTWSLKLWQKEDAGVPRDWRRTSSRIYALAKNSTNYTTLRGGVVRGLSETWNARSYYTVEHLRKLPTRSQNGGNLLKLPTHY